jgi:hypothetical protein
MRFPSLLVSLTVILGSITLILAIIISLGIIITSHAEQKIAKTTTTAIAANRIGTAIATAANTTYKPLVFTRGNFAIDTSLLLANHNETDYRLLIFQV